MTSTEPSQEARETECDESAPLLPSSGPRYDNISRLLPRWTRMQWRVMLIAAFMMLTANLGVFMGLPPQVKIYEDIICNNYKRALEQDSPHQISLEFDGDICQSPPVQNELALVIGWENTLDVLPSIAIALPYGVLTDRIGRRPFVLSSTIATALTEAWPRVVCWFNWPLRLVWLTGVLRAPGGGDQLAASLIWTIVADVFEEEERATALFRLVSLIIIAELVAVPFGAYTMTIDPWIPYLLGVAIMFVGAVCSIFMPETLNEAKARETDTLSDERTEGTIQPSPLKGSVFDVVIYKAQRFATETRFMWSNSRFLISLAAVFAGTLSRCSQILLIQYASIKYQWSISQASYLISLRSGMSLASFLVFVPLLSFLLLRQLHLSSFTKDLVIARVAAVSGVIGYLLISVAPTPPLLVTGCLVVSLSIPFVIAMVNVTTSFTSPEHVATLHTAMAMCQSIGIIVAGPMFAKLYGSGLQLGVEWSGLPFAVAGSICVLILVSLLFLEVPSDHAL